MEWKDIKNYEGIYQASNDGLIRSLNYKRTNTVKILKYALDKKGYLRTALMKDGKLKTVKVHRVIAQTFIENEENKPQVNHINGIKTDNRVENLEWVTNRENQIHAIKNGLTKVKKRGLKELNNKIRKTDEFVLFLHSENKKGISKRELSRIYGVDRGIFRRNILKNV